MISKSMYWCPSIAVLALGWACSDERAGAGQSAQVDEGHIASTEEALGVSCANATPTESFHGEFSYVSPRTYSPPDCFKGVVIDHAGPFGVGSGAGGSAPLPPPTFTRVTVSWADDRPTTQAACEESLVRGYLFRLTIDGPVTEDVREVYAQWNGVLCRTPSFDFVPLADGAVYRMAVNARTGPTSARPTRKVRVKGVAIP